MKTQDALHLLVALEERVARIYFHFFCAFREDPVVARCWWEMAQEEYGHAGILKSMGTELPEGAAQYFLATDAHCRCLVEAAGKVPDRRVRRCLEAMLAGPHEA